MVTTQLTDTATTQPMATAMVTAMDTTTKARGRLSLPPLLRPLLMLTMAAMAMEDTAMGDMVTDTVMDTTATATLLMATLETTTTNLFKLFRVEDLLTCEMVSLVTSHSYLKFE